MSANVNGHSNHIESDMETEDTQVNDQERQNDGRLPLDQSNMERSKKKEIEVDADEHIQTLLQSLNKMRETREQSDFIIKVGSEEIFAHRQILSAGSEYFKEMLDNETKEKKTGIAEINGAEPSCVRKCIDFIYTGIPPQFDENIEKLMNVIRLMKLTELWEEIVRILKDTLNLGTFSTTWKLAKLYDLKGIVRKCETFALENSNIILRTGAFLRFGENFVQKLLQSESLTMLEENKLDALLRWVKFEPDKREKSLNLLLKFITLSRIPVPYLRHLIENESLVNENKNILRIFSLCAIRTNEPIPMTGVENTESYRIMIFDRNSGYLQTFNPAENSLVQMQRMSEDMMTEDFTAVSIGNYIYVLMKNKSVQRLLYSDKEAIWERMEDFKDDHGERPPAVILQNSIYVIGGRGDYSAKAVEMFDTSSNKWIKYRDIPRPLESLNLIVLEGQIYCCGGIEKNQCSDVVEQFDPGASSWTTVGSMTEKKAGVSSVAFDEKLFVLGGFTKERSELKHLTTVESYDPKLNSWTPLDKSMKTPRSSFQSFEINREIYAVGGYGSSNSIEKYNFEKNEWQDVEIPDGKELKIVESVKVKL